MATIDEALDRVFNKLGLKPQVEVPRLYTEPANRNTIPYEQAVERGAINRRAAVPPDVSAQGPRQPGPPKPLQTSPQVLHQRGGLPVPVGPAYHTEGRVPSRVDPKQVDPQQVFRDEAVAKHIEERGRQAELKQAADKARTGFDTKINAARRDRRGLKKSLDAYEKIIAKGTKLGTGQQAVYEALKANMDRLNQRIDRMSVARDTYGLPKPDKASLAAGGREVGKKVVTENLDKLTRQAARGTTQTVFNILDEITGVVNQRAGKSSAVAPAKSLGDIKRAFFENVDKAASKVEKISGPAKEFIKNNAAKVMAELNAIDTTGWSDELKAKFEGVKQRAAKAAKDFGGAVADKVQDVKTSKVVESLEKKDWKTQTKRNLDRAYVRAVEMMKNAGNYTREQATRLGDQIKNMRAEYKARGQQPPGETAKPRGRIAKGLRIGGAAAIPAMAAQYGNAVAEELVKLRAENPGVEDHELIGDAYTNVAGRGLRGIRDEWVQDKEDWGGGFLGGVGATGEALVQGIAGLPALVGEASDFAQGVGRYFFDRENNPTLADAIAGAQGGGITDWWRDVGHGAAGFFESNPQAAVDSTKPGLRAAAAGTTSASNPLSSPEITARNVVDNEFGDPEQVDLQTAMGEGSVRFAPGGGLSQAAARMRDGTGGGTFSVIDGTERRANSARLDQVLAQNQRAIRERDRNEQIRKLTRSAARGGERGLAAAAALQSITGLEGERMRAEEVERAAELSAAAKESTARANLNKAQQKRFDEMAGDLNDPEKAGRVANQYLAGDSVAKTLMDTIVNSAIYRGLKSDKWGFLSDRVPDPDSVNFRKALRWDDAAGTFFLDPEIESTDNTGMLFDTAIDIGDLEDVFEDYGFNDEIVARILERIASETK